MKDPYPCNRENQKPPIVPIMFSTKYYDMRNKIANFIPLDKKDIDSIMIMQEQEKIEIIKLFNECLMISVENLKMYL
jgi:hypothetical protein